MDIALRNGHVGVPHQAHDREGVGAGFAQARPEGMAEGVEDEVNGGRRTSSRFLPPRRMDLFPGVRHESRRSLLSGRKALDFKIWSSQNRGSRGNGGELCGGTTRGEIPGRRFVKTRSLGSHMPVKRLGWGRGDQSGGGRRPDS